MNTWVETALTIVFFAFLGLAGVMFIVMGREFFNSVEYEYEWTERLLARLMGVMSIAFGLVPLVVSVWFFVRVFMGLAAAFGD